MTNNKIYERLASLYSRLGISHPPGSAENGELLAYAAVLDDLNTYFEFCFKEMFADTATGLGLSLFCEMFRIDSTQTADEKRELIKLGLGSQYGEYKSDTIFAELEKLGDDFYILTDPFYAYAGGDIRDHYEVLPKLGRIIESYLPPSVSISYDGEGMDFDYWDSTPYLFKDYDNFKLCFDVIDKLGY